MERKIFPVKSCADTIMRHGLVKSEKPVYYILENCKNCKKGNN